MMAHLTLGFSSSDFLFAFLPLLSSPHLLSYTHIFNFTGIYIRTASWNLCHLQREFEVSRHFYNTVHSRPSIHIHLDISNYHAVMNHSVETLTLDLPFLWEEGASNSSPLSAPLKKMVRCRTSWQSFPRMTAIAMTATTDKTRTTMKIWASLNYRRS